MNPVRAISLSTLLAGATVFAPLLPAQAPKSPDSEPAIVYSEAQAIRGQALYYEHCLDCHAETLTGLDQAPPLAGPQFSGVWDGEPLWALVDRIDAMPPAEPGRLTVADNVAILAYLLWYNGLPIGNEPLTEDRSVLSTVSFRVAVPGE